MLVRAREKAGRERGRPDRISRGGCAVASFADAAFDLVTTAFGFRNLANYAAGLRELRRVLGRAARSPFWNSRNLAAPFSAVCFGSIFTACFRPSAL